MTATAIPLRSACRIDLRHIPEADLALCRISGGVDTHVILRAVEAAYADGTLAPGRDRVTIIDPFVALDMVDVDDIYAIQRRIAALESAGPRRPSFRAVFVAPPAHSAIALHIHELLWEKDGRVLPEFCHVSSLKLAAIVLGYPGLVNLVTEDCPG
jgi:hypothetical protein